MLYNKFCFKSIRKHKNSNVGYILELTQFPTWLGKIFNKKPRTLTLGGSGSVWYFMPSGKRAGTGWEGPIVNILEEQQFYGQIDQYR